MRDGRRQFATGEIIPFLDQYVCPEGGVAEAKRARRREKQAFLKTVLIANDVAAAHRAAQKKNAPDTAATTPSASKKRSPRAHRGHKELGLGGEDGVGRGAVGREPPGRAWPYGPVCMVVPTRGKETGSRRRSGESGRRSSTGEVRCSDADDGAAAGAGAVAVGATVNDAARGVSPREEGTVAPSTDGADAGTETGDAGNSSPVNKTGEMSDSLGQEHPAKAAARKTSTVSSRKGSNPRADDGQQLQPGEIRQQENEIEPRAADQARVVSRAATPSPVVTSSVRVLDMGIVRPSE